MTKDIKTTELQDNELDAANGGFSWGASNPTTLKDVIVTSVKNGQPKRLDLDGGEGNDLLIGGAGRD